MYERSAIVLERYFENLLGYRDDCNIRDNFENYCKLVEKLEKYQINFQKEVEATKEFRESVSKIKSIQAAQEKLYQKSAELEYNRNLLFGNVEGKVEETKKCIEKIEDAVEANHAAMKERKEELIAALVEYNEKRFELSKCKRYKKIAENEYNEILEISQNNFEGISPETIKAVKSFANFDDVDDIVNTLDKNGKGEKIPFNEGVMQNATIFGIDIAKKEAAGYLVIYDKMSKLLTDIKYGNTRVELHKKYLRNEKAKMDFIFSAKEYMIQFLDYERMTVIYGRKSHNRLMSEACESFALDIVQINNLYELLLMEIANKATKKAYKSLYNKSYLIDIQEKEEKFKKEKSRVNLNTATLINSNYWRIDGIKAIYTMFYKNVIEVFGREVEEFDMPKEDLEDADDVDEIVEAVPALEQESIKEGTTAQITTIPFEIGDESDEEDSDDEEEYDEYDKYAEYAEDDSQETIEAKEDFDIFGEKYKENDFMENIALQEEIAAKKAEVVKEAEKVEEMSGKEVDINFDEIDDLDDVEDAEPQKEDSLFEELEEDEEPVIAEIKPVKRKNAKKDQIEDIALTADNVSSTKILKKFKRISNSKKNNSESSIW